MEVRTPLGATDPERHLLLARCSTPTELSAPVGTCAFSCNTYDQSTLIVQATPKSNGRLLRDLFFPHLVDSQNYLNKLSRHLCHNLNTISQLRSIISYGLTPCISPSHHHLNIASQHLNRIQHPNISRSHRLNGFAAASSPPQQHLLNRLSHLNNV